MGINKLLSKLYCENNSKIKTSINQAARAQGMYQDDSTTPKVHYPNGSYQLSSRKFWSTLCVFLLTIVLFSLSNSWSLNNASHASQESMVSPPWSQQPNSVIAHLNCYSNIPAACWHRPPSSHFYVDFPEWMFASVYCLCICPWELHIRFEKSGPNLYGLQVTQPLLSSTAFSLNLYRPTP